MPIKFRCQHCNHLLGISRSKAGEQVDCPACGRAIRVPDLDGNVRPVAEPSLLANDPKLQEAFRQLDQLENPPQLTLEPKVKVSSISIAPLPKNDIRELEIPTKKQITTEDSDEEIDALLELEPIINIPVERKRLERRESFNPVAWWSLTIILVIVAFASGFYVGTIFNSSHKPETSPSEQTNTSNQNPATPTPDGFQIKGNITYKQPSGEIRPDRGARIFLLPQAYSGMAKLPANGFRAGDTTAEFAYAVAKLEELGGTATLVKDDGNFELNMKQPGDYSIVIISRFAERTDEEVVKNLAVPIMLAFFQKPNELLGKVACHAHLLTLKDQPSQTWTYTFAP